MLIFQQAIFPLFRTRTISTIYTIQIEKRRDGPTGAMTFDCHRKDMEIWV